MNLPPSSIPALADLADTSISVLEISVIIVSWNAHQFLAECLDSLTHGVSRSYEVIVVDNASTDGSPEMVAARFPWVVLVRTGANLGFAKGTNLGINRSRGKYLALVNSDVHVLPGCLDQLAAFLDENPGVGMVGPRIRYGDKRQQSSCRRFPGLWNNTCEVFQFNKLFPHSEFFAGEHMFYFCYDYTREVEVLVGCFIFARRDAVKQYGLLDEDFWMYGEDIDWCWRCRQSGWKIMFYPGAEAIHYCGGSSANDPPRFALAQQHARLQFWGKHRSGAARLGLFVLLTLQCGFRFLAAIATVGVKSRRESSVSRARVQVACLRALLENMLHHSPSALRSHP
jgi:GT2 family glycosyltransferase